MSQKYFGNYGPSAQISLENVAKLNQPNAFNNSNSHRWVDHGIKADATITIDAKLSNAHRFTVAGPCTVVFSNWELATHVTPLLLTILNPGSSSLSIPNVKWVNNATGIEYNSLLEYIQVLGRNPATLNANGKERFVFWSENGGSTIYGRFQ